MLQLALFPLMVIGMRVCPKGLEGSMYSLLMACTNIGWSTGNLLGAGIMVMLHITASNFDNLIMFLLIGGACKLAVLPFIKCLVPGPASRGDASTSSKRNARGGTMRGVGDWGDDVRI